MPPENDFSLLIRELRSRLGISQAKFANQLHVSFPTVNRWERGKTLPDTAVRHLIAQFVGGLGSKYSDLHQQFAVETSAAPAGGPSPAAQASRRQPRRRSANGDGVWDSPMDTRSMEAMLWSAACSIRGEKDAPKFKDYILPLVFIKRLSDVFEDEVARLAEQFGGEARARKLIAKDHSLVRFFIPDEATWPVLSGRQPFEWPEGKAPKTLGEHVTTALRGIARQNPRLQGVIDTVDFNETRNGERELSDTAIRKVIEGLSDPRYRLGLNDVEPDFLGRAYEYLLQKFATGQGQSAGEFFTPKEVGWMIAYLMEPREGEEIYDPCCGSGGLLVKCQLALKERVKEPKRPLKLHGQELTGSSYAIAHMNMVVHDMEGEIVRGNSMINPKFLDGSQLRPFDIVVTNPMWNQDNFDTKDYETDPLARFEERGGYAPSSTADWAWMQHVAASLGEKGRAAVVIDTGAASRGSGSQGENKEKTIRRWFIEKDLIEAVVLLPDNLFYNTTAAGLVMLLNMAKPKARRHQILMINASGEFRKGRPKNELTQEGIAKIVACHRDWSDRDGLARVVEGEAVVEADYNVSPSRYVTAQEVMEAADIQGLLDELASCDKGQLMLNRELASAFAKLGFRWEGGAE